jgi:hypothetical protein
MAQFPLRCLGILDRVAAIRVKDVSHWREQRVEGQWWPSFGGQKGDPGLEGKTEITSRQQIKDIEVGLLSGAEETNIKRIPSYRPVPETKIIEVRDANPYFWNY